MLFNTLEMAPPDPILGLAEAFKKDPTPGKINLGIGVYKDAKGNTPVFQSVKRAEMRILTEESTKNYVSPNSGTVEYCAAVQNLLFGAGNPIVKQKRAASAHTPGGTGGLRLAADCIALMAPKATIWGSDPTWPNHPSIFQAAGLAVKTYPYYDANRKSLDFDQMLSALKAVPEGDFVLLHGCCHNPTGLDLDAAQWKAITGAAKAQKWFPLIDFAYQGLAGGIEEDCLGVRAMCAELPEALICSSFSKNFGLYNERVGAMTLVAETAEAAEKALSHVKRCIRTNYSNPPAHGSSIVTTILNDPDLRKEWEGEVKAMRERIHGMRVLFVETLKAKGVKEDFSFLIRQKGMFSFSGLTKAHVDALKEKYGIYIVGSGRINVAGMTPDNMDRLCTAIADVLANA